MRAFPSKTFLLGEYLVLEGGPALVLAHPPAFHGGQGPGAGFAPASPAGRLALARGLDPKQFFFKDPHAGRGGFGASGAEFLTVAHALGCGEPWQTWELYRELGLPGSGTDILVQAFAPAEKISFVYVDQETRTLELRPPAALGLELTLFHTQKKLATHEHLATKLPSLAGAAAIVREEKNLVRAVRAYAEILESNGLVATHSQAALQDLKAEPTVQAAKGCGAMGSDVLLVLGQGAKLEPWAKRHSLVEVLRVPI